jgi:hypothetical protein
MDAPQTSARDTASTTVVERRLPDAVDANDEKKGRAYSNPSCRDEFAVVIALDQVAVQIDPRIDLDPSAR